jgi:beta propeller repeat protein
VANNPHRVPAERWCASAGLALVLLLVSGSGAQPGDRSLRVDGRLLVRLRAEGPHAVQACAEARSRSGQPFVGVTADGSDSLDRLHARVGMRRMRALFRSSRSGSFARQREDLRRRLAGGREPDSIPDLSHVYRVQLAAGADVVQAAALYAADPHVVWAQPEFEVDLDFVPDDPFLASSGSWGQGFRDLWGLDQIRAPEAWDRSLGEGVIVAVVDSGVDYLHPDLADNSWVNPGEDLNGNGRVDPDEWNGVDDDANGYVDDLRGFDFANSLDANEDGDFEDAGDWSDNDPLDDNGHGTHVAGTVAAIANNGVGIAGVAPRAKIMALKGFPSAGSASIATLARAMVYAVEHGARVINNSWSCSRRCPSNPVAEEVVALAHARGVVVVTSAGNRRDDVVFFSPEKLRETIVVSATTPDAGAAGFTNRGLLVDVAAPGSGPGTGSGFFPTRAILSLLASGAGPGADGFGAFVVGDDYLRWAGTSMSAPHVAGVAALILSQEPSLDAEGVRARIRSSALDLGAHGHDATFGAGLLDAARALSEVPADLHAAFDEPAQGAIVDVGQGPVLVRGRVEGADLEGWTLSVGTAPDPAGWELLASHTGPADGVLLRWDTRDRSPGAYALRLQAEARDGRRVEEFRLLSLERTRPEPISFGEGDATSPRVSGDLVVWESEVLAVDGEGKLLGLELFLGDLASGESEVLVSAPGDQRSPALDGRRLAWLDGRALAHDIFSCEIEDDRQCRVSPIAVGENLREAPALAGNRIAWTELAPDEGLRLRACEGEADDLCELLPIFLGGTQSTPSFDGDLLVWAEQSVGGKLMACDLSQGRCDAAAIGDAFGVVAPVAESGLFAWSLVAGASTLLFVCELDADSLACPAKLIGIGSPSAAPALSGDRLVWHGPGDGGSDIFFCEFDRRTRECPVQRLTGSMANERNPHIDGDRVVWEDDRQGLFQVYGLALPSLQPIPDRRVSEGRVLKVRVSGTDASGEGLALSATLSDGQPVESLGMRFSDLGRGKGQLSWRAAGDGPVDVTFAGTDPRGLQTRRTVRIDVEAKLRSGQPSKRR